MQGVWSLEKTYHLKSTHDSSTSLSVHILRIFGMITRIILSLSFCISLNGEAMKIRISLSKLSVVLFLFAARPVLFVSVLSLDVMSILRSPSGNWNSSPVRLFSSRLNSISIFWIFAIARLTWVTKFREQKEMQEVWWKEQNRARKATMKKGGGMKAKNASVHCVIVHAAGLSFVLGYCRPVACGHLWFFIT